jgi:hypothetical protein
MREFSANFYHTVPCRMFNAYAHRKGVDVTALRFLRGGEPIDGGCSSETVHSPGYISAMF